MRDPKAVDVKHFSPPPAALRQDSANIPICLHIIYFISVRAHSIARQLQLTPSRGIWMYVLPILYDALIKLIAISNQRISLQQ